MSTSLITVSSRDHRPFSAQLEAGLRPLDQELRRIKSVAELDEFVQTQLDDMVGDWVREPPQLKGARKARTEPPEWQKDDASGKRLEYVRRWVVIEVTGDITLLESWPDKALGDLDLVPVDLQDVVDGPLTFEEPTQFWQLGFFDEPRTKPMPPMALGTYMDVTADEEEAIRAGALSLVDVVEDRRAHIEPIVEAIAKQTEAFFDDVPARVREVVERKRAILARRELVDDSLTFSNAWKLGAPQLDYAAQALPEPKKLPAPTQVSIPANARLSPKTFSDLQRTIRVWANAIERHPDAFTTLLEDRISDLLAATLAATLPGADREVYSRSGKTDIFVRADVFGEGNGPAKVFIAETKWVDSATVVTEAIDPQLLSYLTSYDTAAVLLLLLRQQDRVATVAKYLAALRGLESYRTERASSVEGWPLMVFEKDEMKVSVCVATVHVPPTTKTQRELERVTRLRDVPTVAPVSAADIEAARDDKSRAFKR